MQKNVLVSFWYLIEVLIKQITLTTSWEFDQGKSFIKWILNSKAEDVPDERILVQSFLNHNTVMTQ